MKSGFDAAVSALAGPAGTELSHFKCSNSCNACGDLLFLFE